MNDRGQNRKMTRRTLLGSIGVGAIGATVFNPRSFPTAWAAAPAAVPGLAPLNLFPQMVHEHFVRRVRQCEVAAARLDARRNNNIIRLRRVVDLDSAIYPKDPLAYARSYECERMILRK